MLPDVEVCQVGDLLRRVEDGVHRPLHVGLTRADPDITKEDILDDDVIASFLGDANLADLAFCDRIHDGAPVTIGLK